MTRIFKLFLAASLIMCQTAYGGAQRVDEKKAIESANLKAAEIAGNLLNMKVTVSRHSTPWNEYISKDARSEYLRERMNKLSNREYWAVYYYPDVDKTGKTVKGGDFCIFVDAHTAEIITDLRWK